MEGVRNTGPKLKDKVAIITGGAQGIGRAFSLGMADEGAKIVVSDINVDAANVTVRDVEARGGEAIAIKSDVSVVEDTLEMARKAVERFGRIDILVNNAAIFARIKVTMAPFYELDIDEWDRVIDVNLKGPFLCARAVFPYMKQQKSGKIINLSSATFFKGSDAFIHYVASKGGVISLTRSMARTLGKFNINVNSIAPGRTFSEDADDEPALRQSESFAPKRLIQRVEYPEDLVGTAIFLASSDSDFITGQTIVVDGGEFMH
jgi:3-oxoacyl-[acyl-carrier protein] reductase